MKPVKERTMPRKVKMYGCFTVNTIKERDAALAKIAAKSKRDGALHTVAYEVWVNGRCEGSAYDIERGVVTLVETRIRD